MDFKLTINTKTYKPELPIVYSKNNLILETNSLIKSWTNSDSSSFFLIGLSSLRLERKSIAKVAFSDEAENKEDKDNSSVFSSNDDTFSFSLFALICFIFISAFGESRILGRGGVVRRLHEID